MPEIGRLDQASAIPPVFPYTVINDPATQQLYTGGKFEQIEPQTGRVA